MSIELVEVNIPAEDRLSYHRVAGRKGTWYELDRREYKGTEYILLESERFGDMACGIIVCASNPSTEYIADVSNGWDDLIDHLQEEDTVDVGEVLDKEFTHDTHKTYSFGMSISHLRGEVYITNLTTDEQIFMLQYEEAQEVISLKDRDKQMVYLWNMYQDIIEEHIGE